MKWLTLIGVGAIAAFTTFPLGGVPLELLETRPAPTSAYTDLRWMPQQAIAPGTAVNLTYNVKVR